MKQISKKIAAFLFLLAGCMPVTFTLSFLYRQQLIRHEMKEKLELEMLHTIIVPQAEVKWVKHKKEARVRDKMFDIKSYTLEKGQYTFKGLYDEEETALNNYFEKSTDQKNERGFAILSAFFKILLSIYPGDADEALISKNFANEYSQLILEHITSPFINIITPPPQQAS
jgi:hypothetical protein